MPQLEGQHCWVFSISQPIFSFLVVALCIRGTDVRSNSNSVHPFIFVRDDPDGVFSISIRVLPYAARLDDGTVKQYEIFLSIGLGQSWYATRMSSFCDMLAGGPTWTRKTRGWERETTSGT